MTAAMPGSPGSADIAGVVLGFVKLRNAKEIG